MTHRTQVTVKRKKQGVRSTGRLPRLNFSNLCSSSVDSVLVKGSKQIEAPVTATKMTKSIEASPSSVFGGLYKDRSGGVVGDDN